MKFLATCFSSLLNNDKVNSEDELLCWHKCSVMWLVSPHGLMCESESCNLILVMRVEYVAF